MISFARDSNAALQSWLASYGASEYAYRGVGSLLNGPRPTGYRSNKERHRLASGDAAWRTARASIADWVPFSMPWVLIEPPGAPVEVGTAVAVGVRLGGLTFGGVCRINAVIDEPDRFGLTYGTTRHVASGEEMFLVSRDDNGDIWFTIDVFARPAVWYTWVGRPIFDRYRQRFRDQAARAMVSAVQS